MKKLVLFSAIILFSANTLLAQSSKPIMIYTVPQYVLIQGLRVDIEKNFKNNRNWLVFGPQVYLGYTNKDGSASSFGGHDYYSGGEYDKVMGGGLDIYHKIFLEETDKPLGVYYSYGLSCRVFNMKFKSDVWDSIYQDGVKVWGLSEKDGNQQIYSFGFGMIMGYQTQIKEYLITDIYCGVGARYSDDSKGTLAYTRRYDRPMWDYAYTGTQLLVGLRLGVFM